MKNIIVLFGLLFLISCSSENEKENVTFEISTEQMEFSVDGGEQTMNVISNVDWDFDYTAEWLLVRHQQGKVRVIVEENMALETRDAEVVFLIEGKRMAQLTVFQEGVSFEIEETTYQVASEGEVLSVPVGCNTKWSVENSLEWCKVSATAQGLNIVVNRNFQMNERSGTITIKSGVVEQQIIITQSACEWYESFEMINVEAGTFYLGAQSSSSSKANYDPQAYAVESPVHRVTLDEYSISKYEVTQSQWIAAMSSNPSSIQGDNLPVESVTYEQVQEFISKLNQVSGLNYRLPTEAEWEFAAEGGNQSEGYKYSGASVIGACGWYYSNAESTTHDVGSKDANELGIYDMTGNVREWCSDWFDYYSSANATNPQGPKSGDMKVTRGGSWTTPSVNCRNTYRFSSKTSEAAADLGFRLVLAD